MRAVRATVLGLALCTSGAHAGPCDMLNAFSFSPDDTTKCIEDMKNAMALKDLQIRTLQSQVCWLGLALATYSPTPIPDSEGFVKDACPRLKQPMAVPKRK